MRTWRKEFRSWKGWGKICDAIGAVFLGNLEVIKIKILSGLQKKTKGKGNKKSVGSMGRPIP